MKKRDIILIAISPIILFLGFLIYDVRNPRVTNLTKDYTVLFSAPEKVSQANVMLIFPLGKIKTIEEINNLIKRQKGRKDTKLKKIGRNHFSLPLTVKRFSYTFFPTRENELELDISLYIVLEGNKKYSHCNWSIRPYKYDYLINNIKISNLSIVRTAYQRASSKGG